MQEKQLAARLQGFQQLFLPALEQFFIEQKTNIALKNELAFDMLEKLREFTLRGGKRVRPALLYYCYQGFQGANAAMILPVAIACELMQSFLLIHDDIMDEADIRRGGKTMHKSFSPPLAPTVRHAESMAILAGDIAGYLGIDAIMNTRIEDKCKCRLMALYAQTCINVSYGQALDVVPFSWHSLNETTIFDIYSYKTAYYTTEFPLLCAALLTNQDEQTLEAVQALGRAMGILFQIQDDVLGLFGDPNAIGKSVSSDVLQGKKTLLICKAWEMATTEQQRYLQKVYGNMQASAEEIIAVRDIVIKTESLAYVAMTMQSYARQAKSLLDKLDLLEDIKLFFEELIDDWSNESLTSFQSTKGDQKEWKLKKRA